MAGKVFLLLFIHFVRTKDMTQTRWRGGSNHDFTNGVLGASQCEVIKTVLDCEAGCWRRVEGYGCEGDIYPIHRHL